MAIKDQVITRLNAVSGLTNLVGDRIGPPLLEQGAALPALTLRWISKPPVEVMGASSGIRHDCRLQVDIWAETLTSAEAVEVQLLVALDWWKNTVGTVVQNCRYDDSRDIDETEPNTHHLAVDFLITFEV